MAEKLFLVDGAALFYRSYYAFFRNPLINSKGENTSVTYGFLNALARLLEEENPQYLAVVFDTKAPTFRHKLYNEYKSNRKKMPEDMAEQLPRLFSSLKELNFNSFEKDGYEADDVIGHICKKFAGENLHIYIVSGDKDMAQLVTENVFMYEQGKLNQPATILKREGVKEKLGVWPEQVIDWLTMIGDSSDNIPGIPKVGKVTAVKLLNEYGSLAGVYENKDKLKKGVVTNNIINHEQQTELSKQLATIKTDIDMDINLDDLVFKLWDNAVAQNLMKEMEFRSLSVKMMNFSENKTQKHTPAPQKIAEKETKYQLVDTIEKLEKVADDLEKQERFVFDLETDSLDFITAKIAGIALSWKENEGYYIPLIHPDIQLDSRQAKHILEPAFKNKKIKKIAHNIKFDAAILRNNGYEVNNLYFDTMIASYLINPAETHKLDSLSEAYLGYEMIHIEALIGKGSKQLMMTDVDALKVAPYAAEDADITLKLFHIFKDKLKELNLEELFYEIEMPLIETLMRMETNGVQLDLKLLERISVEVEQQLLDLEQNLYEIAGEKFNLNSPQQLGAILFDKLEIHKELHMRRPPKTKTGQYSTGEKILERYAKHPFIYKMVEFRKLTKLLNTYIKALPEMINKATAKVHTSFNQAVAATGRLSSTNPNLQNIPIRTDIGREIRKAFIPSQSGYKIVSADYSQIELRIMAHLSRDETMINAFKEGHDIHKTTAALIFNIDLSDVTAEHRRKAKEINFGIIYGMSKYGLASRLGISVPEAEAFINDYFATYPKIYQFMRDIKEKAKRKGYVETITLRRRYVPEIESNNRSMREFAERTAINSPIQGSAADLIKKAMIDVDTLIIEKYPKTKMLLQVHDELVFEAPEKEVEAFSKDLIMAMEKAFTFTVPVLVECGSGNDWLAAH
jgi:DNA polymerase-1